jgi:hypothetical protein
MTRCNSDAWIIVRRPTFVRINLPWLSHAWMVYLLSHRAGGPPLLVKTIRSSVSLLRCLKLR